MYRFSSIFLISEKSESLGIEDNFVTCCLYVTFSSFSVVCHFLLSFRKCSERVTWKIKNVNSKFSLNFIKEIKLYQNKQIFVSFVTNLSFFDSFLVFSKYFQLKHISPFILDQYLIAVNIWISEILLIITNYYE